MDKKKILFAHCGGAQGNQGSFGLVSTLRSSLSNNYEIRYPVIEDPEDPTYEMWYNLFKVEFKKLNEPIILVGHSLGASMILKYLSEEKPDIEISGVFLVAAPFWGRGGWDINEFKFQRNFQLALKRINKMFLYQCENDTIVPFEHLAIYKKAFPQATVRELAGTDHLFSHGIPELVLDIKSI